MPFFFLHASDSLVINSAL